MREIAVLVRCEAVAPHESDGVGQQEALQESEISGTRRGEGQSGDREHRPQPPARLQFQRHALVVARIGRVRRLGSELGDGHPPTTGIRPSNGPKSEAL